MPWENRNSVRAARYFSIASHCSLGFLTRLQCMHMETTPVRFRKSASWRSRWSRSLRRSCRMSFRVNAADTAPFPMIMTTTSNRIQSSFASGGNTFSRYDPHPRINQVCMALSMIQNAIAPATPYDSSLAGIAARALRKSESPHAVRAGSNSGTPMAGSPGLFRCEAPIIDSLLLAGAKLLRASARFNDKSTADRAWRAVTDRDGLQCGIGLGRRTRVLARTIAHPAPSRGRCTQLRGPPPGPGGSMAGEPSTSRTFFSRASLENGLCRKGKSPSRMP